jgi:hypothetical protein
MIHRMDRVVAVGCAKDQEIFLLHGVEDFGSRLSKSSMPSRSLRDRGGVVLVVEIHKVIKIKPSNSAYSLPRLVEQSMLLSV